MITVRRLLVTTAAVALLWLVYLQSVEAYNHHTLVPHRTHDSSGCGGCFSGGGFGR